MDDADIARCGRAGIHLAHVPKGNATGGTMARTSALRRAGAHLALGSDIFESFVKRAQMGRKGDAFLVNEKLVLQTNPRFGGHVMEDTELPFQVEGRFQGARVQDLVVNHQRFLYGWAWLDKLSFNAAYAQQLDRKRARQLSMGVKLQF